MKALIPVVSQEANKTLLQIAVDMASIVDTSNVIDTVKAEFDKALAKGQEVLANASATQSEVDEAVARLSKVMHFLSFTKGDKAL